MSTPATTHPTAADVLNAAAADAGYAPSIHNTQPWRWRVTGETLDLYVDRSRVLEATDPDARLATLSCGVALHHARLILAAQGRQVAVRRLPDPAHPDHLARLRMDGPVAADPRTVLLAGMIRVRHTDRRPAGGEPVDRNALRDLTMAVERQGTRLHLLRPDQVLDLAAATSHAQETEAAEPQWRDEMARWTGDTRPSNAGVPDGSIPATTPQTTVAARDFGHHGDLSAITGHDESAVFGVLWGPGDDRLDWLRAGEALSAAWLTATARGISLLPLSAAVEVAGAREAVRRLLTGLGHPYLALRLGTAKADDAGAEHAARLPADQTVERVQD